MWGFVSFVDMEMGAPNAPSHNAGFGFVKNLRSIIMYLHGSWGLPLCSWHCKSVPFASSKSVKNTSQPLNQRPRQVAACPPFLYLFLTPWLPILVVACPYHPCVWSLGSMIHSWILALVPWDCFCCLLSFVLDLREFLKHCFSSLENTVAGIFCCFREGPWTFVLNLS